MYNDEPPERIRPADIDKREACPASIGGGSRLPTAAIDRWRAVLDALEAALANGGDVERAVLDNAAWLDPVQRAIVADLVSNGVLALAASDAEVQFEPEDGIVFVDHPSLNAEFASHFQIRVTDPRDSHNVEFLKVRTGRRGTDPLEASVVLTGGEPGVGYADLMLRDATIEPIELSAADLQRETARLYESNGVKGDPKDRRPGWQCYTCGRVATCGQYPPPPGYRVGRRQRTILLAKSDVLRLDQCQRRVAWKALYGIPKDTEEEAGPAAARGIRFHEILAEVLVSDDPDAAFAEALDRIPANERDEMVELYGRHRQIEASHVPVDVSLTEYQVGATFIVEGVSIDSRDNLMEGVPVAVTVICRTDAVGREPDATPAVVEHRTGATSDRIDERETALYAVSTARLVRADAVAVHQHALGTSGDPECIRILYDPQRLAGAEHMLTDMLAPVANWHPLDASQPDYTVGDWCSTCPYLSRCSLFR